MGMEKRQPGTERAGVTRFSDVVEHDGHAWVLARDEHDYFYECLRCGDRVHVLTREEMAKAEKHSYAYMPLNHRAPWNAGRSTKVWDAGATEPRIVQGEPYPPCARAGAPLRGAAAFPAGPVVAVPRGDEPTGL